VKVGDILMARPEGIGSGKIARGLPLVLVKSINEDDRLVRAEYYLRGELRTCAGRPTAFRTNYGTIITPLQIVRASR
jgi:hypothetical protein